MKKLSDQHNSLRSLVVCLTGRPELGRKSWVVEDKNGQSRAIAPTSKLDSRAFRGRLCPD